MYDKNPALLPVLRSTLTLKRSGKRKVRWVADISSDRAYVSSPSPTCATATLMLVLRFAAQLGWHLLNLDVFGAYLFAPPSRHLYVSYPHAFAYYLHRKHSGVLPFNPNH